MFLSPSLRSAGTATVRAVKRRKMLPTKAALSLVQNGGVKTPTAILRVKELVAQQGNAIGLKIGVKQRGCNGLSYVLDYATEKGKFDEEVNQDGVKILIDKKAQLTLLGTEMDYQETKLASEFVFNNPNITGTCGCGESFSV
eukprot:maker-scaffold871_size86487-snap-gene-0.36 protein:Tk08320 transcript:maker-scaffold871_size86487-snap-gene-0.36-mRNA-1 annotation:"iron-sulfur cluster assembly 1 mitochondrial precursor"